MRNPILILSALVVLLSTSCRPGVSSSDLQDMRQQVSSLERSVAADEEYLRTAADYHRDWMAARTDSSINMAGYARYVADSAYRAEVESQDRKFSDWFQGYLMLGRRMRLQVSGMQNWLFRLETEGDVGLKARRSFTARLEDYLLKSRDYRSVSARYQQVKAGYDAVK